ncbi:MAG: DNA polymerase IV [Clostridiales bacterium]|nr:DNA polymerase IV [Clostridiales bacterium]
MNRILFHIDVNSAFLSWTAIDLLAAGNKLDIRTVPAIIGGDIKKRHGVVLAKSIPAKKYGIQTGEPIVNAFRKCPSLLVEPPDHASYQAHSREFIGFLSQICPDLEQVSIDECFLDFTPIADRFPSPQAAASYIKDHIREQFGFTVNVGISDRKILAKMASDFRKPDLVHTLYHHEIQKKMWPLPVSALFMCGKSSVDTLHKLEINTIGDLARADLSILDVHLKSHGRLLWEYANGIDDSWVVTKPAKAKGIGNSITLKQDALTREDALPALRSLAESVSERLRKSGQLAGMVSTEIKYATFRNVSHQATLSVPANSSETIFQTAIRLFDEIWDGTPIRLLGIRSAKLSEEGEPVQLSLFDYKTENPDSVRQQNLDKAIDSIRTRFGKDAIVRGSLYRRTDDFKKH